MTNVKQFSLATLVLTETESPDELLDSEPSPTNFSQSHFQPILSPTPVEPSLSLSSHTDGTPTLSSLSSNELGVPSLITDDQLEHSLDEFVTHQQPTYT